MKNAPTDINDEYGAKSGEVAKERVAIPCAYHSPVHEPYIPKPEPGLVYRNDGHKHLKSFGTLT